MGLGAPATSLTPPSQLPLDEPASRTAQVFSPGTKTRWVLERVASFTTTSLSSARPRVSSFFLPGARTMARASPAPDAPREGSIATVLPPSKPLAEGRQGPGSQTSQL